MASGNVKTFVYASSAAVYGEPVEVPVREDHPLNPINPYGASKVAGEAYVKTYSNIHGYRPVILRIFNVYGPGQTKSYAGVIEEFRRRLTTGEPLLIHGDGLQKKRLHKHMGRGGGNSESHRSGGSTRSIQHRKRKSYNNKRTRKTNG